MDRLLVLETLMKEKKLTNYLEIGVFNAHIFFRMPTSSKVAVDPEFQFDWLRKAGKTLLNPRNLFAKYLEKTSDDLFRDDAPGLFAKRKINLALIDGMHEYHYALRDIENTLSYGASDVVIVVHDCNPQKREDAISFQQWKDRRFSGTWNGDVWKAILHLRSLRHDLDVFVLDCDHGLGIITKRAPQIPLSYSEADILRFHFSDFEGHRNEWLNLKPARYFYEYFGLQ